MKSYAITLPLMLSAVIGATLAGCADTAPPVSEKPKEKAAGAKLKTTDEIGEFKPEEGREIVDSKIRTSNPLTAAVDSYDPIKQKIAQDIQIQHAVRLFQATEGRYPKDYDEFMTKVIKANKIRLPQLGTDREYQYDVENHQLVVVRVSADKK